MSMPLYRYPAFLHNVHYVFMRIVIKGYMILVWPLGTLLVLVISILYYIVLIINCIVFGRWLLVNYIFILFNNVFGYHRNNVNCKSDFNRNYKSRNM